MVFKTLRENIDAYLERDPAARGAAEVILCYPGFHAIVAYRLCHWLWGHQALLLARFLSHVAKILTGVEIHPAAIIGRRFVIDHGTGVVIGETAQIGNDVTIYHDVTLGGVAPSVESHMQVGQKRHPTLEDDVIVGSGAQILGPVTVGANARIGANSVVTKDIAAGATAVGIPAREVVPKDKRVRYEFQAYGMTGEYLDPLVPLIEGLGAQIDALAARIGELEAEKVATGGKPADSKEGRS